MLPAPIQQLILAFERLPGIGPKTAARLAFFLLRAPEEISLSLAEALSRLKADLTFCQECFNITLVGRERCEICEDEKRDASLICVVEEPLDVLSFERLGAYRGKYHVLHGLINPIEGIGPEDLKIRPLLERVRLGGIQEVILATDPTLEGDATAQYLAGRLRPLGVRVTRLARGLPVGGDLEYADQNTLLRAFAGRHVME
ncbi:MAG: recombination mediator RecR [Anaerolineales bacterium]|nr:recombination mediator RecR [Anaerolineales bacterium]MDW8227600.1 recombination mediator RecR [Anaerolineales bacterium]